MGKIQQSVNQALALGAAAAYGYANTPGFKEKALMKTAKSRKQTIADIVGTDETGNTLEIKEHPELFEGKEGLERSLALDEADKKYVETYEELAKLNPSSENIKALAHRKTQSDIRHAERQGMLTYKDTDEYIAKEVVKRADATKASKNTQLEKVKNRLKNVDTSLGKFKDLDPTLQKKIVNIIAREGVNK